jgi:hypothetical protein
MTAQQDHEVALQFENHRNNNDPDLFQKIDTVST